LKQNVQKFFDMHGEDIVSMAIHPDLDIVATGQMAGKDLVGPVSNQRNMLGAKGRKPLQDGKLVQILVWRSSTMELICKLEGFHRRAVRHLKFSSDGRYLMSIGEDEQNSVAVYDWQNKTIVCSSKVSPGKLYDPKSKVEKDKVFDAQWKDSSEFAVCGPNFVKIFTVLGSNLNSDQA
jgi:echinoderm microtubule-associated protein-like 6